MRRYQLSFDENATADLLSIRDFIARDRGREFADGFIERIASFCGRLSELPHRGTSRDQLRAGLRTVCWRRTVTVAFEVHDDQTRVQVLPVLYRGRDLEAALKRRQE